jgi:tetratricopeptide (TPR) repeat protein
MSIDTCQTFALRFWSWPESLGLVGFIIYPIIAIRLLLQRGLKGLFGFALLCPWLLFFTEVATVRIQEIFVLYRSYLWMAGLFAGLPFVCHKLTAKQAVITLSCVVLLMIPLTWFRLDTFSHAYKVWDDAARRIEDDNSCPVMDRIMNNRAREFMVLGRYPEAVEDLNRSVKWVKFQKEPMGSVLASNYYNRGFAHLKMQQFQLALNDFNIIVGTIPKEWVDFYFYKAQAFEGLHELVAAHQLYEQACVNGVNEGCVKQKELEMLVK